MNIASPPATAPAELAPYVRRRIGVEGWRLDLAAIIGGADDGSQSVSRRFREWSSTWQLRLELGPERQLEQFTRLCAGFAAVDDRELLYLDRADVGFTVDSADIDALAAELAWAKQKLATIDAPAWVLVGPDGRSTLGELALGAALVVAEVGDVWLLADPQLGFVIDNGEARLVISSVHLDAATGAISVTGPGDVTYEVAGDEAAALVAWCSTALGSAGTLTVSKAPAISAFAQLFGSWERAIDAARNSDGPLTVTSVL